MSRVLLMQIRHELYHAALNLLLRLDVEMKRPDVAEIIDRTRNSDAGLARIADDLSEDQRARLTALQAACVVLLRSLMSIDANIAAFCDF